MELKKTSSYFREVQSRSNLMSKDCAPFTSLYPATSEKGARGGAVVEVLRYKPEGRGIDSRWCHWNFSLT
jgi:hypothetical protein